MLGNTWFHDLKLVNLGRKFLALFSSILILQLTDMTHFGCGRMLKSRFDIGNSIHTKLFVVTFCGENNCISDLQMMVEVQSWPYSFPASEDFLKTEQRGNVNGRLLVQDR